MRKMSFCNNELPRKSVSAPRGTYQSRKKNEFHRLTINADRGISHEIKVATIATGEETILEMKSTIKWPGISIKFNNVSLSMTAKKPAKKYAAHSELLFCLYIFSRFRRRFEFTLSSLTKRYPSLKTVLDMQRFRLKTFDLMKYARRN